MRPLDFIGAIELAYDRASDDEAWLQALVQAIGPAFSGHAETTAFFFELRKDGVDIGTAASVGVPYGREHYELQHALGAQKTSLRDVYECDMFTLLSRVVGADHAQKTIRGAGMKGDDSLGLRANMTPDCGAIITTHVRSGYRIRDRALWTRLAAHIGAALRLRRLHAPSTPDSAAAVLDPRGRLEHGSADTVAARDALGSAARDIDRARGKLRRLDPDAASALWRTMVSGEWSLVDWLDHDGKRFLLAQDNRVPTPAPRKLTAREHQVAACAAMGHSNKLIAYDLGLSPGTVAVLLGRAAKKLGVTGRVALIRAFRESNA